MSERPEYDWMEEARQIAAQCWCDQETKDITFDPVLCESIAKRISFWMQTAAQNQRNTDYYRDLLDQCGKAIGKEAYIADDGSESDSVLVSKLPDIITAIVINSDMNNP